MSVIMNYYRHIDRSKVQFDFLCFVPCVESYKDEIEKLGGHIFFIRKPVPSVRSVRELTDFFRTHRGEYQWLHNHEVYLSFFLKPVAAQFGIKNFIVHCHATKYSDRKIAALRNRILCIPIRWMECRKFACSQEAGIFLFGQNNISNGSIFFLRNAIEPQKYFFSSSVRKQQQKALGIESKFVLGHIGRFVPQKNQIFLINVFYKIVQKYPQVCLLLIGDGPLKNKLMEECQKLGIEKNVCFLGQRTDVENLYSAMDIFLLPSLFEGIGIALLEAQANGLLCLASDQVPLEVSVTNQIHFLPLEKQLWENTICQLIGALPARETTVLNNFRSKHYDINIEAKRLQLYYENTDSYVRV